MVIISLKAIYYNASNARVCKVLYRPDMGRTPGYSEVVDAQQVADSIERCSANLNEHIRKTRERDCCKQATHLLF